MKKDSSKITFKSSPVPREATQLLKYVVLDDLKVRLVYKKSNRTETKAYGTGSCDIRISIDISLIFNSTISFCRTILRTRKYQKLFFYLTGNDDIIKCFLEKLLENIFYYQPINDISDRNHSFALQKISL